MESFVNQPYLDKRRKWASWASYAGLAALFVGVLTASRSILISYLFLVIGVIAASIGAYLSNRYVKEPRADQVLAKQLEALDKRYAVYNYYLPAPHVIASHYGLTVVLPRQQKGQVTYSNGKWQHRERWRALTQFFGAPNVGKPELSLAEEIAPTQEWINAVLPGEEPVPVTGLVLFTDAAVQLEAKEAPVVALKSEALAGYMREGLKGQTVLSTARQKELRRLLDSVVQATDAKSAAKPKRKARG
ncbi:MAG: hypothetical protein GX557_16125 [Chloroflexi bacterium]|nr:hypothetical protein [Chloroflexota bacterium]